MIGKTIDKLMKPISVVFLFFGILVAVDYFLPPTIQEGTVKELKGELSYGKHGTANSEKQYSFLFHSKHILIPEETFLSLTTGDEILLSKSPILRQGVYVSLKSKPHEAFAIYEVPFNFFPMYPIFFMLPILFQWIKREELFFMIMRSLSFFLAVFSVIMTFIY